MAKEFFYSCDWKSAFFMDPIKKDRVGYLCALGATGDEIFLSEDIEAFAPYQLSVDTAKYAKLVTAQSAGADASEQLKTVKCVGVLESFSFSGTAGDPITFGAYISGPNASSLGLKMKSALKTLKVTQLGWWIVNYDSEKKIWFEECYPLGTGIVTAQINASAAADISLHVSDQATKVAANLDVNVYHIQFEVVPQGDALYAIHFSSGDGKNLVRGWGVKVGSAAAAG
eukprot:TRINITY_DN13553_c0_g1_i1.p2 TRINITY_DN13553_c0_g1~~TRINITY_DN13553_c0_g1_i1.p2  ORF type:complete len:228 (-),score=1.25 TRINITY_DN13553_c0_g1_i1:199-882(-)